MVERQHHRVPCRHLIGCIALESHQRREAGAGYGLFSIGPFNSRSCGFLVGALESPAFDCGLIRTPMLPKSVRQSRALAGE